MKQFRVSLANGDRSFIVKEGVGAFPTAVTIVRSVLLGSLLLVLQGKPVGLAKARLCGALDALRGDLGARRYFPQQNLPKPLETHERSQ